MLLFSFVYADHDKHHYTNDLSYLELSHTQKKQMKAILKEYRHAVKEYRDYKHDLTEDKEDLFLDEVLDEDKIRSINQKISEYATKIEINLLKQIHAILSQEQKQKFEEYIEEWEIE